MIFIIYFSYFIFLFFVYFFILSLLLWFQVHWFSSVMSNVLWISPIALSFRIVYFSKLEFLLCSIYYFTWLLFMFIFFFKYLCMEKEMTTHSSILSWRIPWTEEPGGLQSIASQSWTQLSNWHTHTRNSCLKNSVC